MIYYIVSFKIINLIILILHYDKIVKLNKVKIPTFVSCIYNVNRTVRTEWRNWTLWIVYRQSHIHIRQVDNGIVGTKVHTYHILLKKVSKLTIGIQSY